MTDVGNPNITQLPPQVSPSTTSPGPTLGQLIGGYSQPQVAAVSPAPGGSPPPTSNPNAAPAVPACKTGPLKTQSITSTMDPTQIVLNDFLDYGAATDHLVANYDSKTGGIVAPITDPSVAFASCSGSAKNSPSGITITLQCKARTSGSSDCQVTFDKN